MALLAADCAAMASLGAIPLTEVRSIPAPGYTAIFSRQ